MSTQQVIRGVMVTFDVFSKNDIEKVNEKIHETFDLEPIMKNSAIIGGSMETKNFVWKIESLPKLFEILKGVCDEKNWDYKFDFMPKYIDSFQVCGYDSPNFPFYIVMAKIILKKDTINSTKDLRKDLFQASVPARLFIEKLIGFRKTLSTFSPSAPLVTQLWVKFNKKEFTKIREMEISLIDENDELSSVQKKELGKQLRSLEQIDMAAPTGDVHSHILFASNVSYVIGHLSQVGLGGFFSPYLLYLSYDEKLLQQDLLEMCLPPAEVLVGQGIVTQEYAHLIGLISLSIYLSKLAFEGEKIDQEASNLRDAITQNNSRKTLDQQLSEINEVGTKTSSLQQTIGRFSRYWEGSIRGISEGKNKLYHEIPVKTDDIFGHSDFTQKGYLGTLADQILIKLDSVRERLEKQGLEIASLRTHISDIVNLRSIKTNESLQKSMKRMTWVMLILTAVATCLSIMAYGSPIFNWTQNIFSESQLLNLRVFGVSLVELFSLGFFVVLLGLFVYLIYCWFKRRLLVSREKRSPARFAEKSTNLESPLKPFKKHIENNKVLTIVGIIGVVLLLNGIWIAWTPIDDYPLTATNTWTGNYGGYEFKAQILCNFTSKGGAYCSQPIKVTTIVIHESPYMENLTRLLFLGSKDYPLSFFEIGNSGIFVPDGGSIDLEYWKSFFKDGIFMNAYRGEGEIFYEREGSYSSTLVFGNTTQQTAYEHQYHQSTEPTIVVRSQAEFEQLQDSKVVLGLTWIVSALTIWTIIIGIVGLRKPKFQE